MTGDATVEDIADAARTLDRLEGLRQRFAGVLPAEWAVAVGHMGDELRRVRQAMVDAHVRETGSVPAARREPPVCGHLDPAGVDGDEVQACGRPAVWQVAERSKRTYACQAHAGVLHRVADGLGFGLERVSS